MNIRSTADFYYTWWIGYNYATCNLDPYGQWRFVDNTVYLDRSFTDTFPWSDNGVNGYYSPIGTIEHEFGHALADLAHQAYTGCSVTNPIMVSSMTGTSPAGGRWKLCGQWGIAADDRNGGGNAY